MTEGGNPVTTTQRCLALLLAATALAWTTTGLRAQNPRLNLLKNSGFEQVANGAPADWTLSSAAASLSGERVHSGRQALKLADPDATQSVSARSPVFSVIPKREYFLRGWAYLDPGTESPKPLGVYLWSLDAQGKEIRGPGGRQSSITPRLMPGQWVHFFQPMTLFEKAVKMRVVLHTFSVTSGTVYLDDVELLECFPGVFGEAVAWQGGSPDHLLTQSAEYSVRWSCADADQLIRVCEPPLDWSGFNGVSLWLHSSMAAGNAVALVFISENTTTEGPDYYSTKIPIDWTGWRQFVLAFKDLSVSRKPLGWNKISRIYLASKGYGLTYHPDLVLHLENLKPVNLSQ